MCPPPDLASAQRLGHLGKPQVYKCLLSTRLWAFAAPPLPPRPHPPHTRPRPAQGPAPAGPGPAHPHDPRRRLGPAPPRPRPRGGRRVGRAATCSDAGSRPPAELSRGRASAPGRHSQLGGGKHGHGGGGGDPWGLRMGGSSGSAGRVRDCGPGATGRGPRSSLVHGTWDSPGHEALPVGALPGGEAEHGR